VLLSVGRLKYLRPFYGALGASNRTRDFAREVFEAAAPRYHQLSRRVAASVMERYQDTRPPAAEADGEATSTSRS
jgi:hypothetical protein